MGGAILGLNESNRKAATVKTAMTGALVAAVVIVLYRMVLQPAVQNIKLFPAGNGTT